MAQIILFKIDIIFVLILKRKTVLPDRFDVKITIWRFLIFIEQFPVFEINNVVYFCFSTSKNLKILKFTIFEGI